MSESVSWNQTKNATKFVVKVEVTRNKPNTSHDFHSYKEVVSHFTICHSFFPDLHRKVGPKLGLNHLYFLMKHEILISILCVNLIHLKPSCAHFNFKVTGIASNI